jgi:hypothetical protein
LDEDRPLGAFALSLAGGVFVVLEGFVFSLASSIAGNLGAVAASDLLSGLGVLAILLGLLIVLFAGLLYQYPEHHAVYGVVVVVLSLASLLVGGGFYLGTILGVVGGGWAMVFEYSDDDNDLFLDDPWNRPRSVGTGTGARQGSAGVCENCRSTLAVGVSRCPSCETPVPAAPAPNVPA